MQAVDRLGWAVTVPLRAGEYVLGVRVNSAGLSDALRQVFPDRVVEDEDVEPPRNLSMWVAAVSETGKRGLHGLYATYTRTVRTESVARMFAALWHELDMRDQRRDRTGSLLDAAVLIKDGAAVILPATWRRVLVDDERRFRDEGFQLVDRRWVNLDSVAGTVTVPATPLDDSAGRLADLAVELGANHTPTAPSPVGTFPITTWTTIDSSSPARRLVTAVGGVLDRPNHGGVRLVHDVRRLIDDLPEDVTGSRAFERVLEVAPRS